MQLSKAEIQQLVKTQMETSLRKNIGDFTMEEWRSYQDYYSGFFDGLVYAGVTILEGDELKK